MNREAMLAPFAEEELQHFEGRGGKTMTYVEDETVMDRLDTGYGPGNWQIATEPIPVYEGVVKVGLGVKVGDEWIWYWDYGYPNRQGGESLKEAVSDGIRRVGRMVGIARDLYRRDDTRREDSTPQRAAPPRLAPRPVSPPPAEDELAPEDVDALFSDRSRPEKTNGHASGAGLTFKALAEMAEARGVAKTDIYRTADKLFGRDTKVTNLTGQQREQIAYELGLTA